MPSAAALKQYLKDFNFKLLFIKELGWDRHEASLDVTVEGKSYQLTGVAHKRGMVALTFTATSSLPNYPLRRKIERKVTKSAHEHIIIFTDKEKTLQIWQWVKREPGKPSACREHHFHRNQSGDALIQKLSNIAFSLEEEEQLSLIDVTSRSRIGFDVEKVTKKFYDRFKTEHASFLKFLHGIPDEELQRWYASVMINRLMFIYFVQKKGFLNNDRDYLRTKLKEIEHRGKDQYYKEFLCPLFFEGFGKKEDERSATMNKLLGLVPYLNGGLFLRHQIEEAHGNTITIADSAFERLFDFFEQYHWHLDERPLRRDDEINPDVLGYIFEKYINAIQPGEQKAKGAYYTKEDITDYISKNTIIPFLFDEAKKRCKIAFEGEHSIWKLLQNDPDRYIYDAVKHGSAKPLPVNIAAGVNDFSKRTEWNRSASEEYALPTEIWREVVTRRNRYLELQSKITKGEIRDINDLINSNLNIRQFAQDVVETCEGPDLLSAFWHAIEKVTVLDPTCGSGAFLFAALNTLEPVYEACLNRMEVFLDEWDEKGKKLHPNYHKLFSGIRSRLERHPNERYFILKSIIINNLYGVDIMEEATEICKLRLFLKLVAQIEDSKQIEPLPDIDFNIRAGNTLVGYVSVDEVEKYLELHSGSGEGTRAPKGGEVGVVGTFDFDNEVERKLKEIKDVALDIDTLFRLFREQQTELGGTVTAKDKAILGESLKKLEDELNRYLAKEYGVGAKKGPSYDAWLKSHEPFHWFVDFYGIMNRGGFDVIIGNPPYVEYKEVRGDYTVHGYQTEDTANLYSFTYERCVQIAHLESRVGLIIPVSSVTTDGYKSLRHLWLEKGNLVIASFNDRPGKLFDGIEHSRLSIVLLELATGKQGSVFTSVYNKWFTEARSQLFETLFFQNSTEDVQGDSIPKIGSEVERSILKKFADSKKTLSHYVVKGGRNRILYTRKLSWFVQILDFVPSIVDDKGSKREPSELKEVTVGDSELKSIFLCALNSTLFYWSLVVWSDCRNLNKREVLGIPLDAAACTPKVRLSLGKLSPQLTHDFKKNSKVLEMNYEDWGRMKIQCIYPKRSKSIIDEIDRVLAQHYEFTDEELDFIINYDIKYRMGRENETEED